MTQNRNSHRDSCELSTETKYCFLFTRLNVKRANPQIIKMLPTNTFPFSSVVCDIAHISYSCRNHLACITNTPVEVAKFTTFAFAPESITYTIY